MLQRPPEMEQACIIPVPIHSQRIKQRGFNQAAVLTQHLAKRLKQPYSLTTCRKRRNTPAQATLDASSRLTNLKGAFEITSTPPQHVILIDDLMTTGATANELAQLLKSQGTQRVDLWCCARAIKR